MFYWSYYKDDFGWPDARGFAPDLTLTRRRFSELGLSDAESESFIRSGYAIHYGDVVIDRYYGGPLMSADGRTRFPAEKFLSMLGKGRCSVPVIAASSIVDVKRQIELWRNEHHVPLLFRGQTASHRLERERPNPAFEVQSFGEVSLLASLWRRMRDMKHPGSYPEFVGLSTLEWSHVIYDQFDLEEIRRRQDAINAAGGWCYSEQDMEDSDDPLLHEFGRTRLDLMVGYDMRQPVHLNTLLQHYGLYSPLLDLTSDEDVALFFATNKFSKEQGRCEYEFVGTNTRKSVIYVFAQNDREMLPHDHARVMNEMHALRPIKQSCVVCTSGALATNLAADFLVGIIKLDFEHEGSTKYSTHDLFPPKSEDRFLSAILRKLMFPERVTEFR